MVGNAGLPLHRRRERHLEAERALDRQRGRQAGQAARGTVDHVDAQRLQLLGEGHRVLDVPAARTVDRRDADEHRLVLRPVGPHRARRGEREAHAAGAVAAILVVARVADRRQELRQQIAVRAMDLDHVVARRIGARAAWPNFFTGSSISAGLSWRGMSATLRPPFSGVGGRKW